MAKIFTRTGMHVNKEAEMQIRDARKYSGQEGTLYLMNGEQVYGTLRYAGGDQIAIEQWFNKGTVQICLHQIKWWYRLKSGNQNGTQYSTGGSQVAQNDQVVTKVLEALDEVGLNHSCTMGKAVILEGGLSDHMKALCVPAFRDAITGGTGMINGPIAQKNMLPARRALLAHVAGVLQEQGATLKGREDFHASAVDEVYHFVIEGREIDLVLMPS